jgi:hypothetical protein
MWLLSVDRRSDRGSEVSGARGGHHLEPVGSQYSGSTFGHNAGANRELMA